MTPIRFLPPRASLYVVALLGVFVAGCSGNAGAARLPVTGRITGSGADTLVGSISFTPAKGNDGLGATCALTNGSYRFDRTNGPTAGTYDVSIRRTPTKPTGQANASQTRQEWTFKADVPASGPYNVDFKLD
jgi:hypothetical protein